MRPKKLRLVSLISIYLFMLAGSTMSQSSADPLAMQRTLISSNELGEAEISLLDYLKNHPASSDAHFLLGYVYFRRQNPNASLAEFTEGAKGRRPTAEELEIVASDYVLLSDFKDADRWFSQVTAEDPNGANGWYLLGRTKFKEERFDQAIACFERAIALHPQFVEAENNLGLSLRDLNKLDLAKAAFETAIGWEGNAGTDAQPYLNLGTLLTEQNLAIQAVPILIKAVSLAPQNPTAHEQLARAYDQQGDLKKAQSEMEVAVTLSPNTSALHFKLGRIYSRQKLHDLAQHEFQMCAKLNSTHSSSATPNPFVPTAPPAR